MTTRKFLGTAALFLCLHPGHWTLPQSAHAATVRIQEVFYDEIGGDADGLFTELLGVPGFDLSGWTLVGVNGATGLDYGLIDLTGALIPVDGILVVAGSGTAGSLLAVRDFVGDSDWQNGPDALQLRNVEGFVVDALQYGDAGLHNAGEGFPALDVSAGSSLSRDPFGTDTNDNASDFIMLTAPTPGTGPSPLVPMVPLPAGVWMGLALMAVIAAARAIRRRRDAI